MQEILRGILESYRRERFLEGLNGDLPRATDYKEEIDELDGTVADGLEE